MTWNNSFAELALLTLLLISATIFIWYPPLEWPGVIIFGLVTVYMLLVKMPQECKKERAVKT